MKALKRVGKVLLGVVLVVAGAAAGLNPKRELRKLALRKQGGSDQEEQSQALY